MKLKKLNDNRFIVLNDDIIKARNFYFNYDYNIIRQCVEVDKEFVKNALFYEKGSTIFDYSKDCKKIICSTQPLEGVELISLSEVEELILGYSIEKMVFQLFGGSYELRQVESEEEADRTIAFGIECINAYRELIKDKLFTIDDMRKAYTYGLKYPKGTIAKAQKYTFENLIQSLLPKTEWEITYENGKLKLV